MVIYCSSHIKNIYINIYLYIFITYDSRLLSSDSLHNLTSNHELGVQNSMNVSAFSQILRLQRNLIILQDTRLCRLPKPSVCVRFHITNDNSELTHVTSQR